MANEWGPLPSTATKAAIYGGKRNPGKAWNFNTGAWVNLSSAAFADIVAATTAVVSHRYLDKPAAWDSADDGYLVGFEDTVAAVADLAVAGNIVVERHIQPENVSLGTTQIASIAAAVDNTPKRVYSVQKDDYTRLYDGKPLIPILDTDHILGVAENEHYPLCAQTGNDVSYPTGNVLTLHGTPSWIGTPGGKGVAMVAASSQYLDLGVNLCPDSLPFTIAARVKPTIGDGLYNAILYSHSNAVYAGVNLEVLPSGKIVCGFGCGAADYYSIDSVKATTYDVLESDKWYTIVAVIRSQTDMEIWVNGHRWGVEIAVGANFTSYAKGTGNAIVNKLPQGAYYGTQVIDSLVVSTNDWSEEEIQSYCNDPWGCLRNSNLISLSNNGFYAANDSNGVPDAVQAIDSPCLIYSAKTQKSYGAYAIGGAISCIFSYDHITGEIDSQTLAGTFLIDDSHGSPSIAIDSQGYIYVVHSGHQSDVIYWQKTATPWDIHSFGGDNEVSCAGWKFTYSMVYIDEDDYVHLFTRLQTAGFTETKWADFVYDGSTWAAPVIIVDQMGDSAAYSYVMFDADRQVFHFIWSYYDGSKRTDLYYLKSTDKGETWTESDGTPYTLPVNKTTCEKLIDSDDGWSNASWAECRFDSNGYPLYVWNYKDDTNAGFWFIRWTGSAWSTPVKICNVRSSTSYTWGATTMAFNAVALRVVSDSDYRAYCIVSTSTARGGQLKEYRSINQGATWTLVQTIAMDRAAQIVSDSAPSTDGKALLLISGGSGLDQNDGDYAVFLYGEAADDLPVNPDWQSSLLTETTAMHATLDSTVGIFVSETLVGAAPKVNIEVKQYEIKTVAITAETAQTGDTHAMRIYKPNTPGTILFTIANSDIAIGGTSNKTLTVTISATITATATTYEYDLWNVTDDTVVCTGALVVKRAAIPVTV